MIGANDFSLTNNAYAEIYSGAVTRRGVDGEDRRDCRQYRLALDIVKEATAVQFLVVNLPALDVGPAFQASFPDRRPPTAGHERDPGREHRHPSVTAQRGIPVVDLDAFAIAAFRRSTPPAT